MKKYFPQSRTCESCGDPELKYYAMGLCARCYAISLRRKKGIPEMKTKNRPCRICGSSPVKAFELCRSCYNKQLVGEPLAKRSERTRRSSEKRRFGGVRNLLMSRAGGKCERCGMNDAECFHQTNKRLSVHHKDGNGFDSEHPNHAPENLMLLCFSCHRKVHSEMKMGVGV